MGNMNAPSASSADWESGNAGTYDGPTIPTAHNSAESRCWCDRGRVVVTWEMVRAGETVTCGQPDCRRP